MRAKLLSACTVVVAGLSAPGIALADGHGVAPLRVPDSRAVLRVSQRAHIAFTAPSGSWTPSPSTAGQYTQTSTASDGSTCVLTLSLTGRVQRSRPNVGGPLATGGLTGSGTTGSLTWLTGRANGASVGSATQRTSLPRLVPAGQAWTSYVLRLTANGPAGLTGPTAACASLRSGMSLRATISTVHLVAGAA
jgi:hypothetical protein